jgi:hypothetical protein
MAVVVFSGGFDRAQLLPPSSWLAPLVRLEAENAARVIETLGYQGPAVGTGGTAVATLFLGRVEVALALLDAKLDPYLIRRLLDLRELALWAVARDCCITWS